ncbi:MAG: (d)CMP kinase [Lactobacillaceae bacterium]|jgi:cytidylate kinase|nr:(d)CMP kinase [Lactobacillaceae bacterium]
MNNIPEDFQIAIDGPASSGKSTIAKLIADDINAIYIDTGAMYRAVTLYAKMHEIDYEDQKTIEDNLKDVQINFQKTIDNDQKTLLNGGDVSFEIRTPEITNNVSLVSSYAGVREAMVAQQREIARGNRVVMDGRDIASTVLPDAQLKIFLVASVEERANRRFKENTLKGIDTPLETLMIEIAERDRKDSTREISPLTKVDDAIEIDTSNMTIQEVVNKIEDLIQEKL